MLEINVHTSNLCLLEITFLIFWPGNRKTLLSVKSTFEHKLFRDSGLGLLLVANYLE